MKSLRNIKLLIGLILIISLFFSACGNEGRTQDPNGGVKKEIMIYTSIYPFYDFASKIAGDRGEVVNLVPPGAEAHDYEPSPKDLIKLSEADVFIYNGGGFESWIDDVLNAMDTSNLLILEMSDHIELLSADEDSSGHGEEEGGTEGHEDQLQHEGSDPHIWLDPIRAKQIAEEIKDALIQVDEEGKETYESNFAILVTELTKLHEEYVQVVDRAERKEMIVSHSAFGYLANRYGLEQVSISGISPSDEPSQKELKEIIAFAKEHDVKYILFETLVSGKVANVVKKQIGAEALTLNPLEGLTKEELSQGKDYFSIMRDNLDSLRKALGSK